MFNTYTNNSKSKTGQKFNTNKLDKNFMITNLKVFYQYKNIVAIHTPAKLLIGLLQFKKISSTLNTILHARAYLF